MNDEVFEKFTKNSRLVLRQAQKIAVSDNQPLSTEHLLLAIIQIPGTLSHDILREYSVNLDQVKLVLSLNKTRPRKSSSANINEHAREALKIAYRIASDFNHHNIDTEHILIALLADKKFGSFQAIERVGINPNQIKNQLLAIFTDLSEMDEMIKRQDFSSKMPDSSYSPEIENYENFSPQEAGAIPSAMSPTRTKMKDNKALEYFAVNLVEKAKKNEIEPVIGREKEIERCIQILLRKTKNNPVFIGDPGVGKTAIVEGLVQRISQGNVPLKLLNKKIYQLDLGLMVAGTMYRGQFEERLKKVLGEIKADKDIILFIDELHTLIGTGSAEGSMDAANLLKPALSKGEIRMIGATTFDEYRKYIEKDAALERRLQTITVNEPTVEETIQILEGIRPIYEKHHHVKIDDSAILAAAHLSKKYINDRFLPDKAIDLIDEAAAKAVMQKQNRYDKVKILEVRKLIDEVAERKEHLISEEKFEEAARARNEEMKLREREKQIRTETTSVDEKNIISETEIASLISQITSIPLGNLIKKESQKFLAIEDELGKYIAGQKEAIREIAKALRRNRAGISEGTRPIGSFIFLGPSGVGKTEVARALAHHIYSKESALVKIDMSEFMERHNLARLTGAPPGYVGYDEAGKLTETVRKNPYSIILFDEIEKAHPEILNVLLQILDEGKLTDAKGRVVNFKNTIVIMTSNIGLKEYKKISKIGFQSEGDADNEIDPEKLKGVLSKKLFDFFRPELINRIDKIIFFDPLKKEDLKKIAQIQLNALKERLAKNNHKIEFSHKVIEELADSSYDPAFGARPLKRKIEDEIEGMLSEKILEEQGKTPKNRKIFIDFRGGKFVSH